MTADTEAVERLATELVRFGRLSMRMRAMLSRDDTGADHSALLLLIPLRHEGPMRITDLAEIKQADPSTVSRQAAQLVRAGLVRREADPVDGRASLLALTPAGEAACERLRAARLDMISTALGDWPDEQVARFTELFRQFNSSVEAYQRDRAPAMAAGPIGAEPTQEKV